MPRPGTGKAFVTVLVLVGAVFLLRMATPDDLRNRDQVRVCAYILDAAYNGNWICQVDSSGDITSKPPLCSNRPDFSVDREMAVASRL